MREVDDWVMQDRKLYVHVPRFIVELEHLGYIHLNSNDFNSTGMKSDEITKLAEELKLISSEITESRIQEEMKSSEITADEVKPKIAQESEEEKSVPPYVKSSDFTEISDEIIKTKNELIDVLKGTVNSREQDIFQLREVISELSKQNKTLTQQNGWLTNLLVAPKYETEPMRSANVTDITHEDTPQEAPQQAQQSADLTQQRASNDDPSDPHEKQYNNLHGEPSPPRGG